MGFGIDGLIEKSDRKVDRFNTSGFQLDDKITPPKMQDQLDDQDETPFYTLESGINRVLTEQRLQETFEPQSMVSEFKPYLVYQTDERRQKGLVH